MLTIPLYIPSERGYDPRGYLPQIGLAVCFSDHEDQVYVGVTGNLEVTMYAGNPRETLNETVFVSSSGRVYRGTEVSSWQPESVSSHDRPITLPPFGAPYEASTHFIVPDGRLSPALGRPSITVNSVPYYDVEAMLRYGKAVQDMLELPETSRSTPIKIRAMNEVPADGWKCCPFCGVKPRHLEYKSGYYLEKIICDACHIGIDPSIWERRAVANAGRNKVYASTDAGLGAPQFAAPTIRMHNDMKEKYQSHEAHAEFPDLDLDQSDIRISAYGATPEEARTELRAKLLAAADHMECAAVLIRRTITLV